MDARELAAQLETAMQGEGASKVLGLLGEYGVELSDEELEQVAGGIRLQDGLLHDLFAKKLQELSLGETVLSALEDALAQFVPNGLGGR